MEKIRVVITDCTPAYPTPNFRIYSKNNKLHNLTTQPYYELTRDAFVLIVMGFTGKRALQWKIDYINAFNKMEAELQKQHTTLFPFDADLFVQIRGGKTALIQQARPGEHFMSFESFKEIAERAGYLVVHGDDLKDMTLDGIMRLGVQASRVAEL
ncbi:Uncharacterized phage-encoded protein [Serratia fonticola]|nr:Uncharacterized phage-encoded protein [Serratia fonticola]